MSLSTVETTAGEAPLEGPAVKGIEGRTPFQLVVARLRTDRVALLSILVIVLIILLAIGAPLIAAITGHGATDTNVDNGHRRQRTAAAAGKSPDICSGPTTWGATSSCASPTARGCRCSWGCWRPRSRRFSAS